MNGLAITYNAKLSQLKEHLSEIKNLNMKTTNYDSIIYNIEKNVEDKLSEFYNNNDKNSESLIEILNNIYNEAIKKIDEINKCIIDEYNIYYKIQAKTIELNSRIKKLDLSNIDDLVFDYLVNDAIELLNSLKSTTNIDYESEESIVNGVYELVYEIIKLENIKDGYKLLGTVKNNEVDTIYISKLIKKDIEELTVTNSKIDNSNRKLLDLIEKINRRGFEISNYLDYELISTIILIKNPEFEDKMEQKVMNLLDEWDKYILEFEENNEELKSVNDRIKSLHNDMKGLILDRFKGTSILLAHLLVILGVTMVGGKLGKVISTETTCETTIETYDTYTNETTLKDEKYLSKNSDEITINVSIYSPWEYNETYSNYYRNVKTYRIKNLDNYNFDNLSSYLSVDAGDLERTRSYQESTDILLEGTEYDSDRYVITKTMQDFDTIKKESSDGAKIFGGGLFLFFATIFDALYLFSKDYTASTFEDILSDYFYHDEHETRKKLIENKKMYLELKNKISNIVKALKNTKENIEEEYDQIPSYFRNNEELAQKVLKLEDKIKN